MGGNPAVYAGLLGRSLVRPVQAAGALGLPSIVTGIAPFLGGAAIGAVLGGVAYVILTRLDPDEQGVVVTIRRGGASDGEGAEKRPSSAGKHMASAPRPGVSHSARHFRTEDWEQTGTIRVQEVAESRMGSHVGFASAGKAKKTFTFGSRDVDYAEVATNYVAGVTLAERMATAARGVANVLTERLGANMMEGIPVIQRADGTVADVGTTWWDDAIEASGRDSVEIGSAAEALVQPDEIRYAPRAASLDDTAPQAVEMRPEPSSTSFKRDAAAKRLLSVDLGVFPEHRSASELDGKQDVWAAALEALEEKAMTPVDLVFEDVVGDIDTLDEPDGLEPSTAFIPFRAPAGHPEVVDTETYVDYLIRQEFTKNPSSAVRRNAREYLHVIEGGTAGMLKGYTPREERAPRRGKHFKQDALPMAKEA